MKGCAGNLIVLGVLGALVATFLVPYFVATTLWGFHKAAGGLLGAGSLGLTLFLLYLWLMRLQKKERTVRGTLQHPVFGEVKQFEDHWEAQAPLHPGEEPLEVWGFTLQPTKAQVANFTAIRERLPELVQQCVEAANDFLKSAGQAPTAFLATGDLQLDGVTLDENDAGCFTLNFEVPKEKKVLPWGLGVSFEDFKVVEVSDNH